VALRAANARLRHVIEAKDTEIEALRASRQTQLDTLRAQVAALSADVAELRARGGQNPRNSSKPPSSEGLAKPALDGLKIEQAIFIGSSFGGFHSVNLAVLHPERVRAMVLLAPAATIKPFKPLAKMSPWVAPAPSQVTISRRRNTGGSAVIAAARTSR